MTSRVEAVRAAIKDVLIEPRSDQLNGMTDELAEATIEANDAWLKERGWKAVPLIPSVLMKIGMLIVEDDPESLHLKWPHAWHIAPTPEEPDQ